MTGKASVFTRLDKPNRLGYDVSMNNELLKKLIEMKTFLDKIQPSLQFTESSEVSAEEFDQTLDDLDAFIEKASK